MGGERFKLPRRGAIPIAEFGGLRTAIRRTTLQRLTLGLAAFCLLLGATLAALRLPTQGQGIVHPRSGVVVLDMSRSISPGKMREIRKVLKSFASPTQRLGLAFFADTAYELLPPGTPGTAVRPLLRFFKLVPIPGTAYVRPIGSPWDYSFRGGTQISQGLTVARQMLLRQGVRGEPVLLVSDLSDFQDDLSRLGREIAALKRDHFPLRIMQIAATAPNRQLFTRLAGRRAFTPLTSVTGSSSGPTRTTATSGIAVALIVIAIVLLAVLGLNEFWCGRLQVPAAESGRTS
jgi:hypothetical protein